MYINVCKIPLLARALGLKARDDRVSCIQAASIHDILDPYILDTLIHLSGGTRKSCISVFNFLVLYK